MELDVFQHNGTTTGRTVALDDAIFGVDPNDHVIWLDVRRTQATARQGNHKTKERGEVRGSNRKLYRQKGTGNARVGNAASPLRRGGGRTFGPRPHRYEVRLSKKVKRIARCSALSYKAQQEAIRIIDPLHFENPNTRDLRALLLNLELATDSVLIVTASHTQEVFQSSKNLPRVVVREARNVSAEDILRAQVLVCEENALSVWTHLWSSNSTINA